MDDFSRKNAPRNSSAPPPSPSDHFHRHTGDQTEQSRIDQRLNGLPQLHFDPSHPDSVKAFTGLVGHEERKLQGYQAHIEQLLATAGPNRYILEHELRNGPIGRTLREKMRIIATNAQKGREQIAALNNSPIPARIARPPSPGLSTVALAKEDGAGVRNQVNRIGGKLNVKNEIPASGVVQAPNAAVEFQAGKELTPPAEVNARDRQKFAEADQSPGKVVFPKDGRSEGGSLWGYLTVKNGNTVRHLAINPAAGFPLQEWNAKTGSWKMVGSPDAAVLKSYNEAVGRLPETEKQKLLTSAEQNDAFELPKWASIENGPNNAPTLPKNPNQTSTNRAPARTDQIQPSLQSTTKQPRGRASEAIIVMDGRFPDRGGRLEGPRVAPAASIMLDTAAAQFLGNAGARLENGGIRFQKNIIRLIPGADITLTLAHDRVKLTRFNGRSDALLQISQHRPGQEGDTIVTVDLSGAVASDKDAPKQGEAYERDFSGGSDTVIRGGKRFERPVKNHSPTV